MNTRNEMRRAAPKRVATLSKLHLEGGSRQTRKTALRHGDPYAGHLLDGYLCST